MLPSLRTYRHLTHLLAGLMLLTSAMPLIQHACMSASDAGMSMMKKCCCVKKNTQGHHGHKMPDHAPSHHEHEAPMPCDENDSTQHNLLDICCSWKAGTRSDNEPNGALISQQLALSTLTVSPKFSGIADAPPSLPPPQPDTVPPHHNGPDKYLFLGVFLI